MATVFSVIQLALEVAILVASYFASKILLAKLPAALRKNDSKPKPLPPSSRCSISMKERALAPPPNMQNRSSGKISRATSPHSDCVDDETSIVFGEDADDLNERVFLTEQQHAQRQQLPVEMDKLTEQMRTASRDTPKQLIHVPSADSLTIEQYRMRRKVSPTEDDSFFWDNTRLDIPENHSFPEVPAHHSFFPATEQEVPLHDCCPPQYSNQPNYVDLSWLYKQEPEYSSLDSSGMFFCPAVSSVSSEETTASSLKKMRAKRPETCRRYQKGRCRDGPRRCVFMHPACGICGGNHHTLQHRPQNLVCQYSTAPPARSCLPVQ